MSNSEEETSPDQVGISDDKLPEDLQPSDDNPLAEGLDEGETVDDLLDGGKTADEKTGDEAAAETDEGEDSDTGES